ncbi:unnamed protein product [Cylindrotheca closterium]|uniref:AB hydrolase-1 domain-containing protein n=1 Tax=Cylindrotheca closterium TaxID=2856 RepID=A0AAD2GD38_9STRA|nr:unnamed protein product [Cylindrotheca closterium]
MITTETFLPLPHGDTYVRIDSIITASPDSTNTNASTTTFLLVHGATVPHWQFDRLVPILLAHNNNNNNNTNTAGVTNRIIRLDLYGHGKSARPRHVRHDLSLFVEQVWGVIQHYQLDDSSNNNHNNKYDNNNSNGQAAAAGGGGGGSGADNKLIGLGHSLGAAVLVGVASSHNNSSSSSSSSSSSPSSSLLFHHLILSAPMLNFMQLNPSLKVIMSLPCVGEVIMKLILDPFLRARRKKRNFIQCQQQLQECFDGTSLLQMFRDGALGDQSMVYQRLGDQLRLLSCGSGSGIGGGNNTNNTNNDNNNDNNTNCTKILVLWGSHDKVVNGHHMAQIIELLDPFFGLENHDNHDNNNKHGRALVLEYERLGGLEHNQLSADPHRCAEAIFRRMTGNPSII